MGSKAKPSAPHFLAILSISSATWASVFPGLIKARRCRKIRSTISCPLRIWTTSSGDLIARMFSTTFFVPRNPPRLAPRDRREAGPRPSFLSHPSSRSVIVSSTPIFFPLPSWERTAFSRVRGDTGKCDSLLARIVYRSSTNNSPPPLFFSPPPGGGGTAFGGGGGDTGKCDSLLARIVYRSSTNNSPPPLTLRGGRGALFRINSTPCDPVKPERYCRLILVKNKKASSFSLAKKRFT